MTESDSMNQITQKIQEDYLDSGKDISAPKIRKEIVDKLIADNPKWKESSVASSLSKSKNKIAKLRNIKPSELGVGKKKALFDDALDMSVDQTGKVEATGLKPQNPLVTKTGKDGKPVKPKESESPLSEEAFGSFGALAYDVIAMTDEDMEDLTEQERKDFANILKPIGDKYFAGEKSTVIIAVGAMCGLILKKKRKAKRVRHERELKEGKKKKQNEKPNDKSENLDNFQTSNKTDKMQSDGGKSN